MIDGRVVFEIRGTQLYNKGAELMLRACIEELHTKYPDAIVCSVPTGNAPYERRASLGLYQKLWIQRKRVVLGRNGKWVPRSVRKRYGIVLDSEIDVLLDASGYCLGDQWSLRRNRQTVGDLRRRAAKSGTVVLLPQAMGPFQNPKVRVAAERAFRAADLVFARDQFSFDSARELMGETDRLDCAPDFTSSVGSKSAEPPANDGRVVVIPNVQMIRKTRSDVAVSYVDWTRKVIQELERKGVVVEVLLHDTLEDRVFAPGREFSLSSSAAFFSEEDATAVKSRIAGAAVVLSSRYHGAVNALSQGVPAFVTSWSHKYAALLEDFNVPEHILNIEDDPMASAERIITAMVPETRTSIERILRRATADMELRTSQMWDRIHRLISSRYETSQ
jgi:polysaccharide pyruvyl transferase WcaK-like protein